MKKLILILCLLMIPVFVGAAMVQPIVRSIVQPIVSDIFGGTAVVAADVPQTELDALEAFYAATDGDNWTDNTGWGGSGTVNDWFGVTVVGGHVTQVDLIINNLVGAAGATLDPLSDSLTRLTCRNNSISTLDVSALTSLTFLNCAANNISTLDVSALTSLRWLYCYSNSISVLDVSALTELTILSCGSNSISTLDVSALTELTNLYCDNNSMIAAEVDNILCDLDTAGAIDGTLKIFGTNAAPSAAGLACEANLEDISRGWEVTVTGE